MPESTSALFALFTKLVLQAFPAAFGAIASLKFLPDTLSKRQRVFSVICAFGIATYFGRGIAEYYHVENSHVKDMIVFGAGLFGLAFAGAAMAELKPLTRAIRIRYFGDATEPAQETEK